MPTTITVYGAAGEIGGNKILLEDGDCRLMLDFGIAFGRQEMFFSELLRPRATRGLLDPLALGLVPPLEGIYRDDLAPPGLWQRLRALDDYRDLRRSGQPALDALFLSHAHLDHNGDMSFLACDIPVYTTRTSAFVARAMQTTGPASFERELIVTSPRAADAETGDLKSDSKSPHIARPHLFLDGALSPAAQAVWEQSPSARRALVGATTGAAGGDVKGLRYRWWPVDHSIPGAMGMAVETSAGWVAYTGDIRFHGKNGAQTRRFAQDLATLQPAALLCEGTHIGATLPVTEATVQENALPLLRTAAGLLAIADFGPRNVDRLVSFLELAAAAGRTLLVQAKDVYLLQMMALADDAAFASPADMPSLALYADPKAAPRPWETALRGEWAARTVGPAQVSANPGDFVLAWSLWDLNDLLDLQGVSSGVYIYSNSRAYDDEQAADLDRLRNWVGHMGLTLHGDPDVAGQPPLHASGHASGPELAEFVRTVRPRTLIPIHTEDPHWWEEQVKGTGIEIVYPEMGKGMRVG
jgi:ribonuclease J